MRTVILLLALLLPGCSTPAELALTFTPRQGPPRHLSLAEMERLVPAGDVLIKDPHDEVARSYRGLPTAPLLDQVFGPDWKRADHVLFTCSDGYQASVPAALLGAEPSRLAFALADGSPFVLTDGKKVPLGPFYLVWDKGADKALSSYVWPYQVTGVTLIVFAEQFPRTAPPPDSSEAVARGYRAFATYCLTCHQVNGEGGTKAVDLASPVKVTDYWSEEYLKRLIDDPLTVRGNATMPPLKAELPDRQQTIDDLVAYLKAVETIPREDGLIR